jgi:hypothetical protein
MLFFRLQSHEYYGNRDFTLFLLKLCKDELHIYEVYWHIFSLTTKGRSMGNYFKTHVIGI